MFQLNPLFNVNRSLDIVKCYLSVFDNVGYELQLVETSWQTSLVTYTYELQLVRLGYYYE